jgi:hypothetical protein
MSPKSSSLDSEIVVGSRDASVSMPMVVEVSTQLEQVPNAVKRNLSSVLLTRPTLALVPDSPHKMGSWAKPASRTEVIENLVSGVGEGSSLVRLPGSLNQDRSVQPIKR